MKTAKMLAYGFTILMLATMVVGIAPSATAQGEDKASVFLSNDPKPDDSGLRSQRLPPESAQYTVKYSFIVQLPAIKGDVCPTGSVTVDFKPTKKDLAASYATMTVAPSSVTKAVPAPAGAAATTVTGFDTTVTIITTRKAPAFQTGSYELAVQATPSAQTSGGCVVSQSPIITFPITLQNDYLPIMEYQPARYIQKTGQNKDVVFSIKMTNFGNGDTKVSALVTPLGKNRLDAVIPPSQTTLESKAVSGEKALFSKDAVVTGRTPHSNGYTNSIYSFSVAFSATAVQTAQDVAKDDQTLTLSVQVQGVYVPGFDPTMAIAALGVALVGLGIRRRE